MTNYNRNWLPHLKDSIPLKAMGNDISMYAIALEAWRRGLIVKFRHTYYKSERRNRIKFTIGHKGKNHVFNVSRGDNVSKEAVRICIDKHQTKEYLIKNNVPTPLGKDFDQNISDEEIIQYANTTGYPVVVKPVDGLSGKGVIVNIESKEQLKAALDKVRRRLNHKRIIVEKHVNGEDCRVYIIDNEIIAATKRVPAYIVGNGKNTIEDLIKMKNAERNSNPNYYGREININKKLIVDIEEKGYTMNTVLPKDQRLTLGTTNNISQGAEAFDITDEITDKIESIAINAAKSIPELHQCSVDMLVDLDNDIAYVLEINSRPQIGLHFFPSKGIARDVPKAIIDYYFPETKDIPRNDSYYFNFDLYMKLLKSGGTKEIRLKKIRSYVPIKKKYTITLNDNHEQFIRAVYKYAEKLRLDGHLSKKDEKSFSLVVGGSKSAMSELNDLLKKSKHITHIIEEQWEKPIMMGFFIENHQ